MNSHTLKRGVSALGISLAVAIAGIAPASFAQPQRLPAYPQPQVQPAQPFGQPAPDNYGRRNAQPENHIDRRLAFLHQRLGITPAQEAAWTEFTTEMRNSAGEPGARPADRGPMNVVQRLELQQHRLEKRSADLDRMLHALRPLYASFSDEQKKVADQLLVRTAEQPRNFRGPDQRNGEQRSGL